MADINLIYWISGIFAASVVGLVIYLMILHYKKEEDPEDNMILENYMPQYQQGHSDGIVHTIEFSEERVKIVAYPRDLKYIRLLKEKLKILKPLPPLFVDKNFIEFFPEGTFSGHRNKIKVFPNDPSLLPGYMKKTEYGKRIMEFITKKNMEIDESNLLTKRMNNLSKMAEKDFGLGVASSYSDLIEKVNESIIKNVGTSSPIKPNYPSSGS